MSAVKEGTVEAISACSNLDYHWLKLFYALKDKILERHGDFCGLEKQFWYDEEEVWDGGTDENVYVKEPYAEHEHILMRYLVGSVFFHSPTDEFRYENWGLWGGFAPIVKKSQHFDELLPLCSGKWEGKKKKSYDQNDRKLAWKSLKWLVREYGNLLR